MGNAVERQKPLKRGPLHPWKQDSQRSHLSSFTMKLMDKFHSPKIKRTPSKKGKPAEVSVKVPEKPANKEATDRFLPEGCPFPLDQEQRAVGFMSTSAVASGSQRQKRPGVALAQPGVRPGAAVAVPTQRAVRGVWVTGRGLCGPPSLARPALREEVGALPGVALGAVWAPRVPGRGPHLLRPAAGSSSCRDPPRRPRREGAWACGCKPSARSRPRSAPSRETETEARGHRALGQSRAEMALARPGRESAAGRGRTRRRASVSGSRGADTSDWSALLPGSPLGWFGRQRRHGGVQVDAPASGVVSWAASASPGVQPSSSARRSQCLVEDPSDH
ncbi:PREDICTED: uncharacterized protein LOC105853266 [Condylura cristata]|uniref:uncharacterized protein LOC105853266 n=1 Tax=Condylura cristata TaxID=143302 RepID=UPI000642BA8F|nr:PREDICTED: uncharacterized protein LOC105853266 [Condylura cristata]